MRYWHRERPALDISKLTNGAWQVTSVLDYATLFEVTCRNEYTTTISAFLFNAWPDEVLDAMDKMYLADVQNDWAHPESDDWLTMAFARAERELAQLPRWAKPVMMEEY